LQPNAPAAGLRESTPPKPAAQPERTRALAGSLQSAPPEYSVELKSDLEKPAVSNATVDKKLNSSSPPDLPVNSRNYVEMQRLAKAGTPPTPAANANAPSQNSDAAIAPSVAQTVTVQSDAESGTTTAPVPSEVSKPPQTPASADNRNYAQIVQLAPGTTAHGNGVALGVQSLSQTVSVESTADLDSRTLVRSPDPQVLWRISSGRYVERSLDAGVTWRAQWTSVNAHVVAGSAPSADTCWLVGRNGIVLLTTDGKKWHTVDPPASADFVAVDASNAASATVSASDGRKFETSDGGKHWSPAP
jgi:hypothetical protein